MKTMFEIAMEAHLDAVPHIEREITAYVKLKDLYDVTSIADRKETHEQWQLLTNSKKGKMRIRLTDGVEHSLTCKENTGREMETVETETKIEASFFKVLKRSFAVNGYLKTRYDINIEGTDRKWEVDVFKKHNGEPSLWIKLDYEFAEGETQLPEIPFDYEEILLPDVDESAKDQVSELWDTEWASLDEKD